MCGVVGVASMRAFERRGDLLASVAAIRHRGPDDVGEWWSSDGRIGFGHARLSIIDLSDRAHQPFVAEDLGLVIAFNGEIYNFAVIRRELEGLGHQFRSRSDTEVIVRAFGEWGPSCVDRMDGMFSFAIADTRTGCLFLARDRAGEKPLYYVTRGDAFYFASELKALIHLAALQPALNSVAADCYLMMGFAPGRLCMISDVEKLPPGHFMTFDPADGRVLVERYWRPPDLLSLPERATAIAPILVDELEEVLGSAVRRQLVADVPVGVLLSGGVDSSLITAIAARCSTRIRTFTVVFPGYGRFDERDHARRVAEALGTEHFELPAESVSPELLPVLARQFDEPIADSSMIPTYLVAKLVRQHCKVALGGDGGDELFGGYRHYDRLLRVRRFAQWIPLALRRGISRVGVAALSVGSRGRNWLAAAGTDLDADVPLIAILFDLNSRRRLVRGISKWQFGAEAVRAQRVARQGDLLQRATRTDFANYLPEDILVKVDRASMLNSLEVRAPLLDRRVIEFAFGRVPSVLKASSSERKILPRMLLARLLPGVVDGMRKQGFSVPLASWLRQPEWSEAVKDWLLGARHRVFDEGVVRELISGHAAGRDNSERLFALVMFQLWRDQYHVTT